MLFDLRGAGRRTTIKIVYLSLAVLMGGGLVLFGIGGDVSGGLFDAFGERNATTDTGKGRYENLVEAAQRETRIDPDDPVAYADLARARYQLANAGDNFDQQTGQYSAEGKRQLTLATEAWERHLALEPKQADDGVASLMVIAYGPQGLNDLEQAVVRPGGHHRGPTQVGHLRQPGDPRLPGGPDPQGRPRDRPGDRTSRPRRPQDTPRGAQIGEGTGAPAAAPERSAEPHGSPRGVALPRYP